MTLSSLPDLESHVHTVLLHKPDAITAPSGEKATEFTPECPPKTKRLSVTSVAPSVAAVAISKRFRVGVLVRTGELAVVSAGFRSPSVGLLPVSVDVKSAFTACPAPFAHRPTFA